ncbi:methyltransferase family protein [Stackebrandtia endophytica]|uniref:Methyltransferase family protein n=1 Tax=Stackebrandtia endophytica TaxID=1496996 RepID=A0A543AQA0_9ACTN|nr:class I SAM-dependent methyltransferase [Stackebrandtia endophytica]TQL74762.1 methyltransferase family protein [Stackebrandtia endophytica]
MDHVSNHQRLNRAMWDERVPIHLASPYYDLKSFRDNPDSLRDFEPDQLGDVTGKSLLHLQCHIGLDTLSWAGHGAQVTGLDFSPAATAAAQNLADEIGVAAEFVTSDVYEAPAALDGRRFDIVYTGIGALCWLPDINRWAQTVAELLNDDGVLYLVEFHPAGDILDDATGSHIVGDYFNDEAAVYEYNGTYADTASRTRHNLQVMFSHTLGSVLTAVADAGLRLELFTEYPYTLFRRFENLHADESGRFHPTTAAKAPLMYSLRARA